MRPKQPRTITCPECGYEYLPGEIFYPKTFLGQPKNVVRDCYGKILGYEGAAVSCTETFTCESCNSTFNVTACINFTTQDLSKELQHKTKLSDNKLFLNEM